MNGNNIEAFLADESQSIGGIMLSITPINNLTDSNSQGGINQFD